MPELSAAQGRIASARTPTSNRDGILPQRRQTDTQRYAVMADLRAANIGDGGADDLKRTLGMFTDAAGQAGAAYETQQVGRYRQEAAAGALDATTGKDPNAAMSKSSMYNDAFYGAKAEAGFNAFKADLGTRMEDLIASGQGPDDVQEAFAESVKGFVEDTVSRIPSDSAKAATAQRLAAMAGEMQVGITKAIKDRTDTEFVTTVQSNIQADLAAGKPVTFEAWVSTFRQTGMAATDAKKAAIDAVLASAANPDDPHPELIDELLSSTQADGKTPSLSPAERLQLQNAKIQTEGLVDRVVRRQREEGQKTFYADVFDRIAKGEAFDPVATVQEAVTKGTFTPEEGMSAQQALQAYENFREEGDVNEQSTIQLSIDLSKPGLSFTARRNLVTTAFNSGRLGTGTAAFRIYGQMMVSLNSEAEAEAKAASSGSSPSVGRFAYDTAKDFLEGSLKPKLGMTYESGARPAGVATAWIGAQTEFRQRVAKGEDPMSAADAVVKRFVNLAARKAEERGGATSGGLTPRPGAAAATRTIDLRTP